MYEQRGHDVAVKFVGALRRGDDGRDGRVPVVVQQVLDHVTLARVTSSDHDDDLVTRDARDVELFERDLDVSRHLLWLTTSM